MMMGASTELLEATQYGYLDEVESDDQLRDPAVFNSGDQSITLEIGGSVDDTQLICVQQAGQVSCYRTAADKEASYATNISVDPLLPIVVFQTNDPEDRTAPTTPVVLPELLGGQPAIRLQPATDGTVQVETLICETTSCDELGEPL